jgi:predicted secreted hydrolase
MRLPGSRGHHLLAILGICLSLSFCSAEKARAQVNRTVATASAAAFDGVRPSYRDQLWRMTGRLVARDGHAFSYAATFFRYSEPHGIVLYPASLSVVDESTGKLFSERRTERADLGLGGGETRTLSLRVGTWRLRESGAVESRPTFDLDAKLDGAELLIRGVARKPRFVVESPNGERDEYSSITSTGTIVVDGHRYGVGGKSWLDHELSNSFRRPGLADSQFRVQLDDGREIYIETSASEDDCGSRRCAYLVERNGTVDTFGRRSYEFGAHPGSTWLSPHSRASYPNVWGLHVDGKTEFLSLEPVTYDQESVAHGDGLSYWDGAVDIYDVTPGSQGLRLGSGFVLMRGDQPETRQR